MLEKYLILIFLPTVVYSHIKINIKPNHDGTDATIDFYGEEKIVVSDNDRKVFRIDDGNLKRASEKYMGKRCGDVYVKPPTPWGNVFEKYGWDIVRKTVKPIEATVVEITSTPVAFSNAEYVNNHDKLDVTYSTSLTHQVQESVSHSWSKGGEAGAGIEIKYEVNFGVASAGGSVSMSYSTNWGEEETKSRETTLGSTSTVLAILPHNQKLVAQLLTTEGKMVIEIKYKTSLNGKVFCNYPGKYKGHYFYSLPLRYLLDTVNIPADVYSTERITMGFYTSARLVVSNGTFVNSQGHTNSPNTPNARVIKNKKKQNKS